MKIGVIGYTDKRYVIYALLGMLQQLGEVALFTDDRHYKRLIDGDSEIGHISNVMVVVSNSTPDEIFENIQYKENDFEHIIYDIRNTIPTDLDICIYCMSLSQESSELDTVSCVKDYDTLYMAFDGKKEKDTVFIPINISMVRVVEEIECFKLILPIPSNEISKYLSSKFAKPLGVSEKVLLGILKQKVRL